MQELYPELNHRPRVKIMAVRHPEQTRQFHFHPGQDLSVAAGGKGWGKNFPSRDRQNKNLSILQECGGGGGTHYKHLTLYWLLSRLKEKLTTPNPVPDSNWDFYISELV